MSAHAGFWGNTAHSRANCAGFNESITWNALASHYWEVHSHHYVSVGDSHPAHVLMDKLRYTWRSAAYHAMEAYSSRGDKWYVYGVHWWVPGDNPQKQKMRIDVTTMGTDCSGYNGWWDK